MDNIKLDACAERVYRQNLRFETECYANGCNQLTAWKFDLLFLTYPTIGKENDCRKV